MSKFELVLLKISMPMWSLVLSFWRFLSNYILWLIHLFIISILWNYRCTATQYFFLQIKYFFIRTNDFQPTVLVYLHFPAIFTTKFWIAILILVSIFIFILMFFFYLIIYKTKSFVLNKVFIIKWGILKNFLTFFWDFKITV